MIIISDTKLLNDGIPQGQVQGQGNQEEGGLQGAIPGWREGGLHWDLCQRYVLSGVIYFP